MSEWFQKKSSFKKTKEAEAVEEEPKTNFFAPEDGDLTHEEISLQSRNGYTRNDLGGFYANIEEKGSMADSSSFAPKPNNTTVRLSSGESKPVEVAWPVNEPRIVSHHGQGATHLPGEDNSAMVPRRPGYARNDTGGFLTTAGSMKY